MNAATAVVVNHHMETLLHEAATHRMAQHGQQRRSRIAAIVAAIRAAIQSEPDYSRSILPTLDAHRG